MTKEAKRKHIIRYGSYICPEQVPSKTNFQNNKKHGVHGARDGIEARCRDSLDSDINDWLVNGYGQLSYQTGDFEKNLKHPPYASNHSHGKRWRSPLHSYSLRCWLDSISGFSEHLALKNKFIKFGESNDIIMNPWPKCENKFYFSSC